MLILGSEVKVTDNSGAKRAQCLKILGGSKKVGRIGDIIVVAIKEIKSRGLSKSRITKGIPKGSVQKGVILRTRKEYRRKDGTRLRFGENAIALLKKQGGSPISTRLFGPILEDLRLVKDMRLLSLALNIV